MISCYSIVVLININIDSVLIKKTEAEAKS